MLIFFIRAAKEKARAAKQAKQAQKKPPPQVAKVYVLKNHFRY